mgnify:FL=1
MLESDSICYGWRYEIILSKYSAQPLVAMVPKHVDLCALVRNLESKSQITYARSRLSPKRNVAVNRNIAPTAGGQTNGQR